MLFKPISVSHDATLFQADVNLVTDWFSNNHLTINTNKTKFMLISRRRKLPKKFPPLYLNNVQIESVSHFRYLGVWISDDLTWSKHVETICCKARRILAGLYVQNLLTPLQLSINYGSLQVPGPTHLGVCMRCLGPTSQKGPTVA